MCARQHAQQRALCVHLEQMKIIKGCTISLAAKNGIIIIIIIFLGGVLLPCNRPIIQSWAFAGRGEIRKNALLRTCRLDLYIERVINVVQKRGGGGMDCVQLL